MRELSGACCTNTPIGTRSSAHIQGTIGEQGSGVVAVAFLAVLERPGAVGAAAKLPVRVRSFEDVADAERVLGPGRLVDPLCTSGQEDAARRLVRPGQRSRAQHSSADAYESTWNPFSCRYAAVSSSSRIGGTNTTTPSRPRVSSTR